ncbi:unnamed protein product [Linum trigynum]|uniref:Uncharacterized protein n=1 Tax=Linum trigynum TaxID=586398 RepID=A0AAV2CZ67_9ROSI
MVRGLCNLLALWNGLELKELFHSREPDGGMFSGIGGKLQTSKFSPKKGLAVLIVINHTWVSSATTIDRSFAIVGGSCVGPGCLILSDLINNGLDGRQLIDDRLDAGLVLLSSGFESFDALSVCAVAGL